MTNSSYPNVKAFIINVLQKSKSLNTLKNNRKMFIVKALLGFLSVKGKINFLQLERYSDNCEQYYRINFEQTFDFQKFNQTMIEEIISEECIIAFDPSYIPKSGKHTYGLGTYWSGCAGKAKRGLDICGFAAVDIPLNTAFHLNAIQTPTSKGVSLLHYYCQVIIENQTYFKGITKYMVADSYFAKSEAVRAITGAGMHFISRLRDDAVLFYPHEEPRIEGQKGRTKKYAGKVNPKNPDMNFFTLCHNSEELKVYNAIVYCKAFDKQKINLSIAVFYKDGKEMARKLYFSTDLEMDGMKVVSYYRSRFQIEFLYRDAKQHCGLEDCQARSENKLNFHFNAALTSVNVAKMQWLNTRNEKSNAFSMADFKTLCNNELLLNQFLSVFAINPNTTKNKQRINKIREYGIIAA